MEPKVSVIIPVYNVEKYLKKCIDSVINQTLSDIEIICIDDGSTDSCPKILDEYAKKDNRIRVIHKENEGYGKTMNIGLDLAQGEYIGIVESDDYILPNMYEVLYNKAKGNNLDLIKSNFYFFWDVLDFKRSSRIDKLSQYYNKVLDNSFREIYFEFGINNWTGIYKKEFIKDNSIRHNETPGASYQDTGFWIQVMSMCQRAMWIDETFYMYRQDNPASSVKSKGKMLALKNEYDFVEDILKNKGLFEELKLCNYYRIKGHESTFFRIDDSLKLEYSKIIKDDYNKYKDNIVSLDSNGLDWVKELCEKPREFCSGIIQFKENIIKKLNEYENIIIYGAGKRAQSVIIKLYDLGFYDKISNVCVSGDIENTTFMNIELKRIKDVTDYMDKLILVAVKKDTSAYDEIILTLKEMNISNYIDTEEIISLS